MKKLLFTFTLIVMLTIVYGQNDLVAYKVLKNNANTILEFPLGIGLYRDVPINHRYSSFYFGVDVKHFLNEKFRIDFSLLPSFTNNTIDLNSGNDEDKFDTSFFRPYVQLRANYPLFYWKRDRNVKVTLMKLFKYNYYRSEITERYINVPTTERIFINFHGGFYSGYFDRRLMVGLNFYSMKFVRIKHDYFIKGKSKNGLSIINIIIELIYGIGYDDYILSSYEFVKESPRKIGWNSYLSYGWNNSKIFIEFGALRGPILKIGGAWCLPL